MSLSPSQKAYAHRLSESLLSFYQHHQRASSLQISVLMAIASTPGITLTELSDRMTIKKGTLSRALNMMGDVGYGNVEGLGLVRRESDANDGRVVHFHLTDTGIKLISEAVK